MMYGLSGWGMWLTGPVVLALIIWLVVSLVRDTTGPIPATATSPGLRSILEERLARGEIDRDEYLEKLAILERR